MSVSIIVGLILTIVGVSLVAFAVSEVMLRVEAWWDRRDFEWVSPTAVVWHEATKLDPRGVSMKPKDLLVHLEKGNRTDEIVDEDRPILDRLAAAEGRVAGIEALHQQAATLGNQYIINSAEYNQRVQALLGGYR